MSLKSKYAIVGVGETDLGKLPQFSQMALNLQAAKRAIEDAGLTNKDIDGIVAAQSGPTFIYSVEVAQNLGVTPGYTNTMEVGGATPVAMVQNAMMAIEAGLCSAVVCVFGEKQRTMASRPRHLSKILRGYEDFDTPFGFPGAPAVHAMACRRHMEKYGTSHDALGAIAIACRKHASLNKNAQMREPLTLEEYHSSKWIVEPFHLLDCCLVTDGSGAVVVTSTERAKDLRKPVVSINGYGQFHKHRWYTEAEDLISIAAKQSSERAYKMAGIGPADVDVAELYDCFTYTVLVELEDYGFCKPGEGDAFVRDGRIEIGGELPVNTHGGLLSQGHVDGMLHITEAVKQLRGGEVEAERQVADVKIAIVSGHGGHLSTHATLILSNEQI